MPEHPWEMLADRRQKYILGGEKAQPEKEGSINRWWYKDYTTWDVIRHKIWNDRSLVFKSGRQKEGEKKKKPKQRYFPLKLHPNKKETCSIPYSLTR